MLENIIHVCGIIFLLLLANVYSIDKSSFHKQRSKSQNYDSTTSNNNDTMGPIVTLGCSMCQQILNITSERYQSMDQQSLFDYINSNHCSDLGLFKKICYSIITNYYAQLYDSYSKAFKIGDTNILPNFRLLCSQASLCSLELDSAFCKKYYTTETHNPLADNMDKKIEL